MNWKLWRHKEDHLVLYEVREAEEGYEFRRPDGDAGISISPGYFPKEAFERVYEPVPEEE